MTPRVRAMSPAELAGRVRQELAKRLDRMSVTRGAGRRRPAMRVARLDRPPGTFFAGLLDPRLPGLFGRRLPEARDSLVAAADRLCRGRFDLLGYEDLSFGDPIDWHLDPIAGRRAPRVHWSRLDALDARVVGDSKVIWELNRHQWLVQLGLAYRLTADERYAQAFAGSLRSWMAANPPGIGINWASSLEVAFRLIAWCWCLPLFRGAPALTADLEGAMLSGIAEHARHVTRYLSYYFSPNTHLTGEALGLFYAGVVLSGLPAAARWRQLGARILVEHSARHVLPDGVYFEQSTHYQRYTAELYLHFLVLAGQARVDVPPVVAERVQRLLDFLLAIREADGRVPQIGDDDGGWLLPMAVRHPTDVRGVFAIGAAVFGRTDYAWAAGHGAPEPLWLLGARGLDATDALRPAPPPGAASQLFPDGGYVVMRSGWNTRAHHLVFDVGPLGCPISAGHGHADLLAIQASVFGRPAIVDPGTGGYTSAGGWRDHFRGSRAHSTVSVDGVPQVVPAGAFRWQERPRAHLRAWTSTPEIDFADAEHDAYRRLPDPVSHRRRVLFVKPRYWLVVDDLLGAESHGIEVIFQLGRMATHLDGAWARAAAPDGTGLLLRAFAPVALSAAVHQGEHAPARGWIAPAYGRREAAPAVVYRTFTPLPLRIMTLLLPTSDAAARAPEIRMVSDDGGVPIGLDFEDGERLRLGDGVPVVVTAD